MERVAARITPRAVWAAAIMHVLATIGIVLLSSVGFGLRHKSLATLNVKCEEAMAESV
jgi:hypothetical protein